MYAPMDIIWTRIKIRIRKDYYNISQIVLRTLAVTLTVILAIAVPDLELLIGLVGAIFFSTLGLLIPVAVETVHKWEQVGSDGEPSETNGANPRSSSTPQLSLLNNMESLLTRLLATPQPPAAIVSTPQIAQLIQFDPDDADADIENVTQLLVYNFIRRELNANVIKDRPQLFRVLRGVSLKRRSEAGEGYDSEVKRARHDDTKFTGRCHWCGKTGHKQIECRMRQDNFRNPRSETSESTRTSEKRPAAAVTCYTCKKVGHTSNRCPDKNVEAAVKEVNTCGHKASRGSLETSTEEHSHLDDRDGDMNYTDSQSLRSDTLTAGTETVSLGSNTLTAGSDTLSVYSDQWADFSEHEQDAS
ncbi:hypothetical protein HW555_013575 [Spodoptera exigua]|uniref:CCHC-type domain-containing protein n=1 Tax=Spodoptera exigua TaxID=7107 RepID=A0A835G366_SPOEX|nr:hypothetical protein HW555_013575 [Spodoptera exigua]